MSKVRSENFITDGENKYFVDDLVEIDFTDNIISFKGRIQFISSRGIYFYSDSKKQIYFSNDKIKNIRYGGSK